MLNENWKKKIGIGEPVRYWQAASFGLATLVLFVVFASVLMHQNRIDDVPEFALGYFVGIIGLHLLLCVIDAERRLQPLEDKICATTKILAQKLKVQEEPEPDPTIMDDAMAVIQYDIEMAMEDPKQTDYLTKRLVPHHEHKVIEETLQSIKAHSALRGMMPPTLSKPLPMSTREFAREATDRKD